MTMAMKKIQGTCDISDIRKVLKDNQTKLSPL